MGSVELFSPALGAAGTVVGYGHYGRPVLVFPSEQGRATDFAGNGMVAAVSALIEAGRVKLYCVDSYDSATWSARLNAKFSAWNAPIEQPAVTTSVVPPVPAAMRGTT